MNRLIFSSTAASLLAYWFVTPAAHGAQHAMPEGIPITCWGDSLTLGTGALAGQDFCSVLGRLLHRDSFNRGVGGETSTQIKNRLLSRASITFDRGLTIIWGGRNNFWQTRTVISDICEMVASLPPDAPYLILGAISGDYPEELEHHAMLDRIVELNLHLKEKYKNRFVDLQTLLGLANNPAGIRSDQIHLTATGYAKVAVIVAQIIKENGW